MPRKKPDETKAQTAVSTTKEHPAEHLAAFKWQPGVSPNPKGRPKGSRNKLGEDFISALHDDFAEHGVTAIQNVRETKPAEYIKVIAGILPKELKVTKDAVEELSDDELARGIAALKQILASETDAGGGGPATKH